MVGEIRENNKGTSMVIIAERSKNDIDVEFLDGHHYIKEHTTYVNFKRGNIKNPFDPTVNGFGYMGIGKHLASVNGDTTTYTYRKWESLINRCTIKEDKYHRYYDCIICDEWKNFQLFAEWFENNLYDIGEERMHIDKDIKYPGNKVYSPYHCLLVPHSINEQFKEYSGRQKKKDIDLPYTIRRSDSNKYEVSYRGKHLGTYNTVDECVDVYMKAKRKYITELISTYKNMPQYVKEMILQAIK